MTYKIPIPIINSGTLYVRDPDDSLIPISNTSESYWPGTYVVYLTEWVNRRGSYRIKCEVINGNRYEFDVIRIADNWRSMFTYTGNNVIDMYGRIASDAIWYDPVLGKSKSPTPHVINLESNPTYGSF